MADDKKPTPPQKPITKRDEKEKPDARIDSIDKGVGNVNKNLDSLIAKQGQVSNRAEQRADLLIQAADTQRKIDELAESGRSEDAAAMQKSLEETSKLLKGSKNDAAIGNRLAELAIINKDTSDLIEKHGSKDEQATKKNLSGIQGVIQKLEEQKTALEDDTLNKDLGRQLGSLGGLFGQYANEETKELKKAYDDANVNLKNAIANGDDEAAAAAREQIEEIKKGAESEENRREAQKINLEANSRLVQIANGMESLGDKYDKSAGAAARGAGFLAGLVGLALMFVDPETFNEVMTSVIESVTGIFDTIYAFFTGDWEGFTQGFSDNWEAIGLLFLGIVAMFGGKMLTALGKGLKIARVFRIFMMGTFIPTMAAAFSSMAATLTPIVAAMAPILLPVLAIMALVGGLYFGFKKLQDSLGPGAGIMDTLKVAMLYFVDFLSMIVNGITFIPRKILGFIGPRLMKWIMGDDFDTSAIENMAEGLDTNRGATAAAEIKAKNEAAAEEKESEIDPMDLTEVPNPVFEELNKPKTTIDGSDILQTSDANAAANKESSTSVQAVITNATGGTTTTNNVIQSTVSGGRETRATRSMAATFSR